jgi:hypothetical protein
MPHATAIENSIPRSHLSRDESRGPARKIFLDDVDQQDFLKTLAEYWQAHKMHEK